MTMQLQALLGYEHYIFAMVLAPTSESPVPIMSMDAGVLSVACILVCHNLHEREVPACSGKGSIQAIQEWIFYWLGKPAFTFSTKFQRNHCSIAI